MLMISLFLPVRLPHPAPADADAAHDDDDDDDGRIQRTVRWETTNFTTFRNFTSLLDFYEFGLFPQR